MKATWRTQLILSLLALSIAANGVLLWRSKNRTPSQTSDSGNSSKTSGQPGLPGANTASNIDGASKDLVWNSLEPDSLRSLATGLMNAGIAPELARVIVQARLAEELAMRRIELMPEATSSPYWRLPEVNAQLTVANAAELRKVARDNAKLVESIFGPDQGPPTLQDLSEQAKYGAIPADKVEQLKMIDDDYRDLNTIYTAEMRNAVLPEDRARLAYLAQEMAKDIKATLSPEEFQEYELRNSSVALGLRANLEAFEPTENEFRKIFALQQTFAEQFPTILMTEADVQAYQASATQRAQAQQALTQQIKAELGPERAAAYEKQTEYNYRMAIRAAKTLDLPNQAGEQLYGLQKDIQSRAATIRSNRELSTEERNRQLTSLQTEATSKVTQTLGGPGAMERYRLQVGGAAWIQSIAPPTATSPAATPIAR